MIRLTVKIKPLPGCARRRRALRNPPDLYPYPLVISHAWCRHSPVLRADREEEGFKVVVLFVQGRVPRDSAHRRKPIKIRYLVCLVNMQPLKRR